MIAILQTAGFILLSATPSPAQTQLQLDVLQSDSVRVHSDRFEYWKQMAKGKLSALRTDPKTRALEKIETAREIVEARARVFENGRGTLDFLLDAARDLLAAEYTMRFDRREDIPGLRIDQQMQEWKAAFQRRNVKRHAASERYWELLRWIEDVTEERYSAGRISWKDLAETRYHRLRAELELKSARKQLGAGTAYPMHESPEPHPHRLEAKKLAKCQRAVTTTKPTELKRSKLDNARSEWDGREREFVNGRGTLEFLIDSSLRLRDAECDVAEHDLDRRHALERYWQRCQFVQATNQDRHDQGRINTSSLMLTTYHRCDAERRLVRENNKGAKERIPDGQIMRAGWEQHLDAKQLAKAKRRAANANSTDLAREKLNAAAIIVDARMKEFLQGRGTLHFLLESQQMWRQASLDVDLSEATRDAAVHQFWELAKTAESVNWERHLAGRVATRDYLETKYDLLMADELLAESMNKAKK